MLVLHNIMEDNEMIYVFDIDGTLSFNGKTIDKAIVESLVKLEEFGHEIIFASARPLRDMVEIVPEAFHNATWIGGNGAFLKTQNKTTVNTFGKKVHEKILNYLKDTPYTYMLDSDWNYTFKGPLDHPFYANINSHIAENLDINEHKTISKLALFTLEQGEIDFFESLGLTIHYHTNENMIDISPGICNKYEAIKQLGIHEYIAFGNDANDVEMFQNAQYSYCVGKSEYNKFASEVVLKENVATAILDSMKVKKSIN